MMLALVRTSAARALGHLGNEAAPVVPNLQKMLTSERDTLTKFHSPIAAKSCIKQNPIFWTFVCVFGR